MSNFDFNVKDLEAAIGKAKENSFVEVPVGKYTVKVEKIELGETKGENGKPKLPMGKIQFRILEGKFAKQCLFWNKVLVCYNKNNELIAIGLHQFNEFLKSLEPTFEIEFKDFDDYKELLLDVAEDIESLKYVINFTLKNDFPEYKVLEVLE